LDLLPETVMASSCWCGFADAMIVVSTGVADDHARVFRRQRVLSRSCRPRTEVKVDFAVIRSILPT
jgi:hypothetical protein